MRSALRPPFAYYGGKQTLAPLIDDLLPERRRYVEPFAASLAVLLAKPGRAARDGQRRRRRPHALLEGAA